MQANENVSILNISFIFQIVLPMYHFMKTMHKKYKLQKKKAGPEFHLSKLLPLQRNQYKFKSLTYLII